MFSVNISQKFIVYLIGISIIPLLIVGIVSFRIASDILQQEASLYTREIIRNQEDYLDLVLRQIQSLIINLSGVDEIRTVIESDEPDSTFSDLNTRAQIGYILNHYSDIDGLVSIDLFTVSGAHYHVGDTLNTDNIRLDIQEDIFEQALNNNQFITWVGVEDNVNANSSYSKVVTAARVLYGFDRENLQQEPLALLLVNYSVETLYEHFNDINPGEDAYLVLLDNHGHLIYHPDPSLIGEIAPDSLLTILSNGDGETRGHVDGVLVSVSITHSELTGWTIASLIPIASLNAQALPVQDAILLILFISFLAVALISWVYNRSVVLPIRQISSNYEQLQSSSARSQEFHVPVRGNDEIAELGRWFNTFIDILATKERNEEELIEDLTVSSALYEVGQEMIDMKNLPALMQKITDSFVELLSANRVSLILFDVEEERITHFYKAGPGAEHIMNIDFPELTQGISGWVLEEGLTALSPEGSLDPRESEETRQRRIDTQCGSLVVVPLKYKDTIRGTVTAINLPGEPDFTPKEVGVMMALANQAIIAIENAELVKSLQDSEEKFFKAFHANPDPMVINSLKDEYYMDVNESFLKTFNFNRHEVIGHTPKELAIWTNNQTQVEFVRELKKMGSVSNFETTMQGQDSREPLIVLLSAEMIEFSGESCVITVVKDITEIKQLEKQRIRFALERERVHILSDFITEASHEFRTPLAIINTNAYLLKKTLNEETHSQKLTMIEDQVHVITRLVDSLSLMTKIDSGEQKFKRDVLDLNNLVYDLRQSAEEQIKGKSIQIDFDINETPILFTGDSSFIMLAIQNLLNNAIQFTEEGGLIHLRTRQEDEFAVIEVEDSGIGIAEDEQKRIFERFYQADKAGTKRGFGLGLPIAEAIVNYHKGRIELESTPEVGSLFRVYLPLNKQTKPSTQTSGEGFA